MKLNYLTIFATATLLLLSQSTWAARPTGSNAPTNTPLTNASGTIERGGMISSIDPERKTITVDGITFPFQASSVSIHSEAHGATGANLNLEQGMLIRFNTVKEKYKGREVISEIWITTPKGTPPKK